MGLLTPILSLLVIVILIVAGLLLSWRVDVNDFSLHHFYRNRLVRCYLGAANPERRQPCSPWRATPIRAG